VAEMATEEMILLMNKLRSATIDILYTTARTIKAHYLCNRCRIGLRNFQALIIDSLFEKYNPSSTQTGLG
jgi:hypothetical protein